MTLHPQYLPGLSTKRGWGGYGPDTDEKQLVLSDIAYAVQFGFEQTRLPTPGATLSQEEVTTRCRQVYRAWEGESNRDKGTRGLDPESDLPPLAQAYLVERLRPWPSTSRALFSTVFQGVEEGGRPEETPFSPGQSHQSILPPPPPSPTVLPPNCYYYDDD